MRAGETYKITDKGSRFGVDDERGGASSAGFVVMVCAAYSSILDRKRAVRNFMIADDTKLFPILGGYVSSRIFS